MILARKIHVKLSDSGIQSAIRQIEEYKQSLNAKITALVERLSDVGIQTVNAVMSSVSSQDDRGWYFVQFIPTGGGKDTYTAIIRLEGDQVLFLEFSAGATYGTNMFFKPPNNPNYGDGMGMGTYPSNIPNSTNWSNPNGWYYTNKRTGQTRVHTYGVPAYAPMFNADMKMRSQIMKVAKEVFGG